MTRLILVLLSALLFAPAVYAASSVQTETAAGGGVQLDPFGLNADAASTTGSISAKLRNMASDIAIMRSSLQLVDDDQTGATPAHYISVGTTEDEHQIKATAGRLFSLSATNTNAAVRYLRCANLTAANTTPGTSAVLYGIALPANGIPVVVDFGPAGLAFSVALTCWFVTGAAETDVAEVAANEVMANYGYK